tara:strand:- start:1056 stop:2666 length:1611 start_codon:yes stop_codon:yes gene_type:complete
MKDTETTGKSVRNRYEQLESNRETFLERARESSKLTIPTLIPEQDSGSTTRYPTPYQGIGARGVNNLSAKLLLALLPPNAPFFRLRIKDSVIKEISQDPQIKSDVEQGLGEIEQAIQTNIETSADRVAIFEALKHLIVGGNVLLFVDKQGTRVFHLERYVCKRDPMGNVLEIITRECLSPSSLAPEVLELIGGQLSQDEKSVDIYTHVCRIPKKNKYYVCQEVKGIKIPKSEGYYDLDKSPFIPLRWNRVDGEDYGRGFVEEYLGDLKSLEGLTQAIVEGSSASAKILFMVAPNGTTRAGALAQSPNGAIIEGNANDVSVLQVQKYADFRIAYDVMQRIEQRLQYAFLLNASVQRQAERVTAEEIRFMAQELEDTLGGTYAMLSQEFQLPYINRKMDMMTKSKDLPTLPKTVIPQIVTGLEALGRGNDKNKLISFLETLGTNLGAEVIQKYVNLDNAISRLATADGIETKGLIKTKEELTAEQNQMMQDQQQNEASSKGFEVGGNVASNIASKLEPEDMQNIDPQAIQEAISQIQS